MKKSNIILASSSPRRIEMMRNHGIEPVIIKPECAETLPPGIGMEDAVMFLSLKKALSVEDLFLTGKAATDKILTNNPCIIAADTVVYKEGIIGKPRSRSDALSILKRLRSTSHFVATGVTILIAGMPKRTSFCEVTSVTFSDYTDEELTEYVNTSEPYDKAGGYAIQGTFGKYVSKVEGDYSNVIGFPWNRILKEYEKLTGAPMEA